MLLKIYNFFKGYVKVRLITLRPEQFLNLATSEKIYIWNLKKINDSELSFYVSKKGFLKLREAVRNSKSRIKIIKKGGLFTYIKKIKKKKTVAILSIIFLCLIIILSSLILKIEVIGNNRVKTEDIIKKLSEINLKKYSLRSNIDSDKISLNLINGFSDISWVGVYEKGSKLIIEIKERTRAPKIIPFDMPCHIIARKDGIVKELTVEMGEPAVNINSVVTKGQVLISGIVPTKKYGMRYVHSLGKIRAETFYEKIKDIPLYRYKKVYTGKKKIIFSFKNKTPFVPYFNYDKKVLKTILPFGIKKEEYIEYNLVRENISKEEAINEGKKELLKELKKDYNNIRKYEFKETKINNNLYKLKLNAILYEDIGEDYKLTKEK